MPYFRICSAGMPRDIRFRQTSIFYRSRVRALAFLQTEQNLSSQPLKDIAQNPSESSSFSAMHALYVRIIPGMAGLLIAFWLLSESTLPACSSSNPLCRFCLKSGIIAGPWIHKTTAVRKETEYGNSRDPSGTIRCRNR